MKLRGWLSFNYRYLVGRPRWDTQISPPELLRYIAENPPGRALDLGCGTGTNALTLVKAGWQVTGIDFAWRAIWLARRRLAQAGLAADLRLGNVTDLRDLKGPFDLVLDIGCFHSLSAEGKSAYVRGILRLIAEEGKWLVYGFWDASGESGFGINPYDIKVISNVLHLLDRQDSLDNRGKPSVWLIFSREGIKSQAVL